MVFLLEYTHESKSKKYCLILNRAFLRINLLKTSIINEMTLDLYLSKLSEI